MFSQANPRRDSLPRTGYRHASYLTTHRQVRYFRITVPHHLQSLLGKKEIRRSLDGLDSRMARSKAMRLSVMHNLYFYNQLMQKIRDALDEGRFAEFRAEYSEKLAQRL